MTQNYIKTEYKVFPRNKNVIILYTKQLYSKL